MGSTGVPVLPDGNISRISLVSKVDCQGGHVDSRCRANSKHMRQSKPESGPGFQVKVLKTFEVVLPRSAAVGENHSSDDADVKENLMVPKVDYWKVDRVGGQPFCGWC